VISQDVLSSQPLGLLLKKLRRVSKK